MPPSGKTSGSHSHHHRRRRKSSDEEKSGSRHRDKDRVKEKGQSSSSTNRTATKESKSAPKRSSSRAEKTKSASDLSSSKSKSSSNARSTSTSRRQDALKASSQPKPKAEPPKTEKKGGFLAALFAGSKPPPSEKKITCLTCFSDDIPINKSARLACSHRMCHACLKRIFIMSVSDPQHMPPRCCTSEHIPLRHVDKLFDSKFKKKWNIKYEEYMTSNRLYCPAKGCGEWIKPSNVYLDLSSGATGGRRYGKCSRCKTKVCVICNGKWHRTRDCPKDADTQRLMDTAKEKGWQRCYNCAAMVELKEGCNHITCRCTAQFCIICGAKWKSCPCPWFNYSFGDGLDDADAFHEMGIPEARVAELRRQAEADARRDHERIQEEIAQRMAGGANHRDRDGRSVFNGNDFMANNPYLIDDFVPLDEQPDAPTPTPPRPRRNRPGSPVQEDSAIPEDEIVHTVDPTPDPIPLPSKTKALPQRRQQLWSPFFNPAVVRQRHQAAKIDKWMRGVEESR